MILLLTKTFDMKKSIITLFTVLTVLFCSCHFHHIAPGSLTVEKRTPINFTGISIDNAFDVYITQGDTEELEIKAYSGYLPHIISKVQDGILKIYYDYELDDEDIRSRYNSKAYITIKSLNSISASGASKISGSNDFNADNASIRLSGASSIDITYYISNTVSCKASGASKISLRGSAKTIQAEGMSGASDLKAYNMPAETVIVDVSGASQAEVNVSMELDATASGASEVKYKGNPAFINQHSSGASHISKVD